MDFVWQGVRRGAPLARDFNPAKCRWIAALFVALAVGGAVRAQVHPIPVEKLADAYERGAVGLVSPQKEDGELTWAAAEGAGFPPRTILTSPTTRTPGLIAAVDFTLGGATPQAIPGRVADLLDFKWRIEATERSKNLVLGLFGGLAGLGLLLGILALSWPRLSVAAHGLISFATAGTVALLLSSRLAPSGSVFQATGFLLVSLILAVLARIVGGRARPVRTLLRLFVLVLTLDTVFHLGLVASSPLSGFYITGIRFYGIGNEYMGLLIGAALMSVPLGWLRWIGPAIVVMLGLSPLGANAGGAMAATVAVVMTHPHHPAAGYPLTLAFIRPGTRRGWRGQGRGNSVSPSLLPTKSEIEQGRGWGMGLAFLAALLVALGLALIERFLLPESLRSHIGRAAGGGPELWSAIVLRKIQMNLKLASVPWTILAALGVGGGLILLARGPVGAHVKQNAELGVRVRAALLGAGAALIFNDSGIVAALLLLAPVLLCVIESASCATSLSTLEPKESVLP